MKTHFNFLMAFMALFFSVSLSAQCNKVGLIGEFTGWSEDFELDRSPTDPNVFTGILNVGLADDLDPVNDTIHVKFRELGNWGVNWGAADFPTGTGTNGGTDIPVPYGAYFVTFDCSTGEYSFVETCGEVSLIGEFNEWAGDAPLHRDPNNPDMWTGYVDLSEQFDVDPNDTMEIKFRMDADWAVSWGSPDFPTGTAAVNGDNIFAAYGIYRVTFNCATGDYSFEETCGEIGIIGELTEWAADVPMHRDPNNPNMWTAIVDLNESVDTDPANDTIELKFRQNADWAFNWGAVDFPNGTGTLGGDNIKAPYGIYQVTFDCSTGAYTFTPTCGDISMIGGFNGWAGDVPMNRNPMNPDEWTLIRSWHTDSEVKFRQNQDWTHNWGDMSWPSGTGTDNGDNIPLVAGQYDVSFNCATFDYSFSPNSTACGEIGMVGDFNDWGAVDGDGNPSDVNLVRDPMHPNLYSLVYSFTSSTKMLFRMDADVSFANTWGGAFPSGTGVKDNGVTQFDIPGGSFLITFDCISGDFKFVRLGSSVTAPKVFNMAINGNPNEADWNFDQAVSNVIDGAAGDDPVTADFSVTYNDTYLFVAAKVVDGDVDAAEDGVVIFVDGNKNGGDYDDSDLYIYVGSDGVVDINKGPSGGITVDAGSSTKSYGYAIEARIPWAALAVTPTPGAQIGFDLGVIDYDAGASQSIIAWNGNLGDTATTSAFGALLFGELSCGSISMHSSTIGDVDLWPTTDDMNMYVGTYEFESDDNVVFRKDHSSTVSWGATDFPSGTATVGGDEIPVTTGRYRVAFGCLDGAYSFTTEAADATVAYANYTMTPNTIDGELTEYSLDYGMDAGVIDGTGPDNNTVTWGADWDENWLYLAAKVVDGVVEGTGNPWENDAVEMYIDGNHDADGTYDGDFDTQIIMDNAGAGVLWIKADGVPLDSIESAWNVTSNGYQIEVKVNWPDFRFFPGRNKSIGFTIGNNDSDKGLGRDYQTAWVGDANNWNNTAVFGDLQLAGGPIVNTTAPYVNHNVDVYPNPSERSTGFFVAANNDLIAGQADIRIVNMMGQIVSTQQIEFSGHNAIRINTGSLNPGAYIVHLTTKNGKQASKRIVIQ